jgi:ATP-dependent Clp protease adaptor protein ClpS
MADMGMIPQTGLIGIREAIQYNSLRPAGPSKFGVTPFFGKNFVMSDQSVATIEVAVEPAQEIVERPQERSEQRTKRQPPYHVILWNDESHSYQYVIKMLAELFGYPLEKGFIIAQEVDTQGRVVVLTTTREHAELKRDQIHAYGKDALIAGCKGSMSATIEPAE